ncbi:unnamed protein product [Moneuplotes crassus]|uniref:FCP1 homology domain-containing protein n=1 Tax=Euplotes crassus TaxID=5936 RepID=A0AAD2DCA4_EUPCR|nr:unnamed protein product [Moneuplotes crassus]
MNSPMLFRSQTQSRSPMINKKMAAYSTFQRKDYQDYYQSDKSNEKSATKKSTYKPNASATKKCYDKYQYRSVEGGQKKTRATIDAKISAHCKEETENYEERKTFQINRGSKRSYERLRNSPKNCDTRDLRCSQKNNFISKDFSAAQKQNKSAYTSKCSTSKRNYQSMPQESLKYKEKGCKSFKNPPEDPDPIKINASKIGQSGGHPKTIAKDKIKRTWSKKSYQEEPKVPKMTKKYSQRRGSNTDENDLLTKSRIPVPNAVRKMIKNTETKKNRYHHKGRAPITVREPYTGTNIREPEEVLQMSYEANTIRDNIYNEDRLDELNPTIQDFSTEVLTDDIKDNLVVNLEHLIDEELCINKILGNIMKKKSVQDYCVQWWEITENSSVKEMQVFFEEELSRRLIKNHQVLLCIFIGFIESHQNFIYKFSQCWSKAKNLIKYLQRSYLVFIQFINNNLSDDQYNSAMDWATRLNNILCTRPVMEELYGVHNSALLTNNNEICTILIKDLLKSNNSNWTFQNQILRILNGLETVDLLDVRTIVSAIVKETKLQKPSPTVNIRKAPRLQDWDVQVEREKRLDDREDNSPDIFSEKKSFKYNENSLKKEKYKIEVNKSSVVERSHSKYYYEKNLSFEETKTNRVLDFRDLNCESFDLENDKQNSSKFHLENSSSRLEKFYSKNRHKKSVKNSKDIKKYKPSKAWKDYDENDSYIDQASCESEDPNPIIPVPVPPEAKQLAQFTKNSPPQVLSKTLRNDVKKEVDRNKFIEDSSHQNPQDESLENFLKNDEKTLYKKMKKDKNGLVMKDWTSTPTKNKFASSTYNSGTYTMNKTFQVNRRQEQNLKTAVQEVTKKPLETPQGTPSKYIAMSLTQKCKTPTPVPQKKAFMTRKDERLTRFENQTKAPTLNDSFNKKKQSTGLVDMIADAVAPFFKRMRNKSVCKSIERDLRDVAKDYRNNKPLRFATPKPNKKNFDITFNSTNGFNSKKEKEEAKQNAREEVVIKQVTHQEVANSESKTLISDNKPQETTNLTPIPIVWDKDEGDSTLDNNQVYMVEMKGQEIIKELPFTQRPNAEIESRQKKPIARDNKRFDCNKLNEQKYDAIKFENLEDSIRVDPLPDHDKIDHLIGRDSIDFTDVNQFLTIGDDETFSLNETNLSPNKKTKFDVLDEFMTPSNHHDERKRSKSDYAMTNKPIAEQASQEESKDCKYQSPLLKNSSFECKTSRKNDRKATLNSDESIKEENQLNQLQLLKRFSVSKSKLPSSHLPDSQEKDPETPNIVNKLQAMNKSEDLEEDSQQDSLKDSKTAPKFLVIDTTEEELEELAKIDAELARANSEDYCSSYDETSLIYEDISMPPIKEGYQYTLVIDLDETLIHYNDEGFYLVRPGVQEFLSELSKYYELMIFTAALKDYADMIIDQIDPEKYITHRLYRQHCTPIGEFHVKDIEKIGRGLDKILIIDNLAESFSKQPQNGILVKDWFDDMEDQELRMLVPFLKSLVETQVPDVREEIRKVLEYSDE